MENAVLTTAFNDAPISPFSSLLTNIEPITDLQQLSVDLSRLPIPPKWGTIGSVAPFPSKRLTTDKSPDNHYTAAQ
jgi:hypothetical protein